MGNDAHMLASYPQGMIAWFICGSSSNGNEISP